MWIQTTYAQFKTVAVAFAGLLVIYAKDKTDGTLVTNAALIGPSLVTLYFTWDSNAGAPTVAQFTTDFLLAKEVAAMGA